MAWRNNPISEARKEHLAKYIFAQYAKTCIIDYVPEENYEIIKKEKVGPFKLILWKSSIQDDPYTFSGLGIERWLRTSQWFGQQHLQPQNWIQKRWEQYRILAERLIVDCQNRTQRLLEKIAQADPTTSGEYSLWIAKRIFAGNLSISYHNDEDVEKVNEDLTLFEDCKRRNIIPVEYRDLHQWTYAEFFDILTRFGGLMSDREALKKAVAGSESIYQSARWQVIKITTPAAAQKLAKGTAWCVRGSNMAEFYLKDPNKHPLYLFIRDGERYALLTNLPRSQQFMDVSDVQIEETIIKKDPELLELVGEFSDWIYCRECERFYWGQIRSDVYGIVEDIVWDLQHRYDLLKILTPHLGRSYLIAQIPSPLLPQPVVAKDELLRPRIVIGPSHLVISIPGVTVPDIDEFTTKAGFNSMEILQSLINTEACSQCNNPFDPDLANILHALYVLKPCEDYPACGHEPLPMGAPGCPPTDTEGSQVGMRCICGAFVPLSSYSSVCKKCLASGQEENDYEEEIEGFEDFDGCRVEAFYEEVQLVADLWNKLAKIFTWENTYRSRDGDLFQDKEEGQPSISWNTLERILLAIKSHKDFCNQKVQNFISQSNRMLQEIDNQGYFDQGIFEEHLVPFITKLEQLLRINYQEEEDSCSCS